LPYFDEETTVFSKTSAFSIEIGGTVLYSIFLNHTKIMPQTTAEKKFFQDRTDKFRQNIALEFDKAFAITKFQGFQENITGGEE
jgi:hypothetical protein